MFQKMLEMLHLRSATLYCRKVMFFSLSPCHSLTAAKQDDPKLILHKTYFFPSNISDDCGPKLNPAGREAKAPNGSGSNQTSAPCQNLLAFNLSTNLHLQDLPFLVKMWNSRITIEILFPD